MSQNMPPGPFALREALIEYGDPVAVRQRRGAELQLDPADVERYADFRFTSADAVPADGIRFLEPHKILFQTRQRLVEPLLQLVSDEQMFLRGVPSNMPPGSPTELIPNAWAFELELSIGASIVRRLTNRWLSVVATTTRPRADELATCRALVDATATAAVGYLPDGAHVLRIARLRLSTPEISREFESADTELRRFRELAAGRAPAGLQAIVVGLDPVGRDLAEHQLTVRHTKATAALMTDFLQRVHDGRVLLTGLQIKPALAAARTMLSPDWAPHMVFDWDRNAVRVFDAVFIDVQAEARRIAPPKPSRGIPAPSRGRGRPSFPFHAFVEIVASPSWRRAKHNTNEADALLAEYRVRYPKGQVPALSTIESHVGRIYEEAARASAPLKSR